MVINSSAIRMNSKTTKKTSYEQSEVSLKRNLFTGERTLSANSFKVAYENTVEHSLCSDGSDALPSSNYNQKGLTSGEDLLRNQNVSMPVSSDLRTDSLNDLVNQLRWFLISFRNRLSMLIGSKDKYDRSQILGSSQTGILDLSSGMGNANVWHVTTQSSVTYRESEELSFETTGKVVTADGRTIDFNMELQMSREYQLQTEELTKGVQVIMTDPLVISLDSNPISVSDQKWQFDIDGDGSEDSISMLSEGAGFLAYDQNGDGKINNGTELFGAKTGNGFADLAMYDEDGNGWIDENDSIYNKLSVWKKDSTGQDTLISLKSANVGAIYLQNVISNFDLKDKENEKQAQIRRSGVYLSEDGQARTIQQLDMVKALIS